MTSGMPAAAQEQVEPLSDRELDVLRLGMRRNIGERLLHNAEGCQFQIGR